MLKVLKKQPLRHKVNGTFWCYCCHSSTASCFYRDKARYVEILKNLNGNFSGKYRMLRHAVRGAIQTCHVTDIYTSCSLCQLEKMMLVIFLYTDD